MPALFGSIMWGDLGWGDDDPGTLDPFTDLGGNPLALPAQAQAIFGDINEEVESTRIYNMHKKGLRQIDAAGTLLWKRLCAGPERLWADLEALHDRLPSLYNVDEIDDQYLGLLKLSALWTDDTAPVTDDLDADGLRQLISQSPELWDRRGSDGACVEILNAVIGVDAFEANWFDRRWILGLTPIGVGGFDPGVIMLDAGERDTVNVYIADPARSLDRSTVAEAIKLWRPANQRVRVVFCEMFDRFDDTANPKAWTVQGGGEASLSPGFVPVSESTIVYAAADYIEGKSDYLVEAVVTPDSTSGYFALVVRHQPGDPTQSIELRVDMDALTFKVWQDGSQLAGTSTIDLAALGFSFATGYPRTIRAECQGDRFAVWLDNEPIGRFTAASALANGTAGVAAGPGVDAQVSFFKMLPLPGQVMLIGYDGSITTNY